MTKRLGPAVFLLAAIGFTAWWLSDSDVTSTKASSPSQAKMQGGEEAVTSVSKPSFGSLSWAALDKDAPLPGRVAAMANPDQGVAGATVCLNAYDETVACTTSDASGNYALGWPFRNFPFWLAVEADGFAMKFASRPDDRPERWPDILLVEGEVIDIQVDDAGGGVVPGAVVEAFARGKPRLARNVVARGTTDDRGVLALRLPSMAPISLCARADGYTAVEADSAAPAKVRIVLDVLATIRGHLEDEAGNPLPDLGVRPLCDRLERAQSAADGTFTISVKPGAYKVCVDDQGWFGRSKALRLRPAEVVQDVVIRASKTTYVAAELITTDGSPCPTPQARLSSKDQSYSSQREPPDRLGRESKVLEGAGRVFFSSVPAGAYDVETRCGQHEATTEQPSLTVASEPVTDLVWRHAALAVLKGQVVDTDGSPVEGATIDGWPNLHATTNADGKFKKRVRPGGYGLAARQAGRTSEAQSVMVTSEKEAFVTLTLEAGFRLQLELLTSGGKPARGRRVTIRTEGQVAVALSTDREGRAEAVLPDGNYEAGIMKFGQSWTELGGFVIDGGPPPPVVLSLPPAQAIRGQVIDSEGTAMADVQVSLGKRPPLFKESGRASSAHVRTRTGLDGSFQFDDVPDDVFTVVARADGAAAHKGAVHPGDAIVLQLEGDAIIAGRLSWPDDAEPKAARIIAVSHEGRAGYEVKSDGHRFEVSVRPGRTYDVIALAGPWSGAAIINVGTGQNEAAISLGQNIVEGIVLNEGRPAAGAMILATVPGRAGAFVQRLPSARSDQAGRFRIVGVPPGPLELVGIQVVGPGGFEAQPRKILWTPGTTAVIESVAVVGRPSRPR